MAVTNSNSSESNQECGWGAVGCRSTGRRVGCIALMPRGRGPQGLRGFRLQLPSLHSLNVYGSNSASACLSTKFWGVRRQT